MKILCVSDTTSSLAYSSQCRELYGESSLVLSCGDLPLNYYDYLSTVLHRDVYYIYGNHNLELFAQQMENADNMKPSTEHDFIPKFYGFLLDGKCVYDKKHDLLVAGLGGSMYYNGGKSQYTEGQMKGRIARLAPRLLFNKIRYGRYLDILITHAPPKGIGDCEDPCHQGFECFLSFMEKYSPKYLLHGHVHLDDRNAPRETVYKNTKVVNVYREYLLDDDTLGGE